MTTRRMLIQGAFGIGAVALFANRAPRAHAASFPVQMTEAEWKKKLTADQFAVLRQAGTERPFTSALLDEHRRGTFTCAGCDQEVFASDTKFDSGTGWPSFWAAIKDGVGEESDSTFGMDRTAIHCSRCGGHLGHVFNDGPKPTGLRYCMNGVAMGFRPVAA